MQRASVDEAYLDITERVDARIASLTTKITVDDVPNTYVTGCEVKSFINCIYNNDINYEYNLKLLVGAIMVEEIRAAVYERTGIICKTLILILFTLTIIIYNHSLDISLMIEIM